MRILVIGDFQGKFSNKMLKKIKKEEFDLIIGVGDYTGISDWTPYIRYVFREIKKGKDTKSVEEYFGKKKFKEILKKDELAARKVFKTLDSFGKPFVYVMGNGDDDWYDYPFIKNKNVRGFRLTKKNDKFLKSMKNFIDLNYRRRRIGGVDFVGFGGYMDIDAYVEDKEFIERDGLEVVERRKKRMERSKKKLFSLFKSLKGEKILVLHYPPKGVFDIIKDKKNTMNGKSSGIRGFREAILKFKPGLVLCGHMHEYVGKKKLGSNWVVNPGDAETGHFAIVDYNNGKVKAKFY